MLNLGNRIDLKRSHINIASPSATYYAWKNIKKLYNKIFNKSAPAWSEKFTLYDGSYFILDIQGYFEALSKYNYW